MNGLPYYKAYPRDFFEGTVGMDFETKAAYRLVLDLIYMHGGRLADDARFISGHLGCSVKKWWALRSAILATGKITLEIGHLANIRADKIIDEAKLCQSKQRDNGSQPKQNKGLHQAMAEPKRSHTDTDTDISKSEGKPSLALLPKANRFSEFWDAYPHRGGAKKGRKPSEAKYAAALKAGVPEQDIIDGARRASQDRQVRAGFARDPTTWLNQAGWNDEIDTSTEMAKGQQNGHRPNERAAFDRSIIAVADGLTAGTIHLDNSSRDPFARKSG